MPYVPTNATRAYAAFQLSVFEVATSLTDAASTWKIMLHHIVDA
jgi:hypothetical protein